MDVKHTKTSSTFLIELTNFLVIAIRAVKLVFLKMVITRMCYFSTSFCRKW
jgi:hypothetical protein